MLGTTEIQSFATKVIEELSEHLFMVSLQIFGSKIELVVDGNQGITIDQCKQIGKKINRWFDEQQETEYLLTVSSPGLDKPFSLWRQFKKNEGRKVNLKLNDNPEFMVGRLTQVNETDLVFTSEPKKKKDAVKEFIYTAEQIQEAKIILEF